MGEFICHLHGLNDFPRIHGFKKNFSALFSRRGFRVRTVAGILDQMECGLGKLTADTLEVSGFSTGIARAMDDNDGHLKRPSDLRTDHGDHRWQWQRQQSRLSETFFTIPETD